MATATRDFVPWYRRCWRCLCPTATLLCPEAARGARSAPWAHPRGLLVGSELQRLPQPSSQRGGRSRPAAPSVPGSCPSFGFLFKHFLALPAPQMSTAGRSSHSSGHGFPP